MRSRPDRLLQVTAVLLAASLVLIAPSVAGLGASLPLAIGLVAVAVGLYAIRDSLAGVGVVWGIALGGYLRVAWLGALVGAVVTVIGLGATPGELQALGGLCGLAGMVNYFLRPIYALAYALGLSVDRRLGLGLSDRR